MGLEYRIAYPPSSTDQLRASVRRSSLSWSHASVTYLAQRAGPCDVPRTQVDPQGKQGRRTALGECCGKCLRHGCVWAFAGFLECLTQPAQLRSAEVEGASFPAPALLRGGP